MSEDSKNYNNLAQEILEAIAEKKFLTFCNKFPRKEDVILQAELIKLHNSGKINVVSEFRNLKNSDSNETDFFRLCYSFTKILPSITSDIKTVVECVSKLLDEPKSNRVIRIMSNSLEEFCKQNEQHPEELLTLVFEKRKFSKFLTLALITGMHFDLPKYLNRTIKLIEENSDEEVKRQAILAMNFISSIDEQSIEKIITCLSEQLDSSPSDFCLSNICLILKKIYFITGHKQQSSTLFKKIFPLAGDATRYELARMLTSFEQNDNDIITGIFSALHKIPIDQAGTLKEIDWCSDQLITHGHFMQLLECVEFFIQNNQNIKIENTFPTFSYCLLKDPPKRDFTITRWLISGNFYLSQAVSDILSLRADSDLAIAVDKSLLTKEVNIVSLVKRAVGFLYIFPFQCSSFLISISETAEDSQKIYIAECIRNPLLLSFPGLTRKAITSLLPTLSPATASLLQKTLDEESEYTSQVVSIRKSTQLGPSESQKEACKRKNIRLQKDISEKARESSEFLKLCRTSVILYKGRTVTRVKNKYSGNSKYKRIESQMGHFSHMMELPLLSILDPLRERFILLQFRQEMEEES